MGTCISKCRPNPSPTKQQTSLPQDKLVISQSPCIACSVHASHGHQHSSSTSSSSSSSSSSTSSIASSICASSCSSSSSSKDGYPRSESPWASVRPPPHIVVLDPGNCKQSPLRQTNPAKFSDQSLGTVPKKIADAPTRYQPPKRARSTSPALVRQKSFRRSPDQNSAVPARCQRPSSPCRPTQTRQAAEARLRTPSLLGQRISGREFQQNTVVLGSRSLRSPSPGRGFGSGAGGGRPKCMREECPSRELLTGESKTRVCPLATRKERLRNPPSPNGSDLHAPRWKRRETSVHPIAAPLKQEEVTEIISDRDSGITHMEDMNNPLISLDCFIFL